MAETIISPGVFSRESDQTVVSKAPFEIGAAIVGPTVNGAPFVPTYVFSYSDYLSKFGDVFQSGSNYYEYFTSLAAREYFNNGGRTLLVTRVVSSSAITNYSTYASGNVPFSGSVADAVSSASFILESINYGNIWNNSGSLSANGALTSGSAYNVRWEINAVDYTKGTFTLLVRRGDDNTNQKNILESWTNLSLDPMQPNFISRVIGDKKSFYTVDSDGNPTVAFSGSYDVKSQYIRVKSIPVLHVNSLDNNGAFLSSSFASTLPNITSGSFSGGIADTLNQKLMNESITTTNIQGFDTSSYITASALLRNKDEYQFNVLLAPGVTLGSHIATSQTLINVCEDRGDAIAIVDPSLYGTSITNVKAAVLNSNSNYAAAYWPWVQINSTNLGRAVWVPTSTVIVGVYAYNDGVAAEWFAPAGLNRGGIPSVITAERKLPQADRDNLYLANINPVATFPGQGVVAYGQKTLQKKSSALDRVNVRRLLISLKRYIGTIAANLVFEQNTNATRNRFLAQVNPYLDSIVQKQGLYAYKVVMDDTNNTPDVIDRNQLVGSIQLQPTKTAEFIVLTYNILPTGVSFG